MASCFREQCLLLWTLLSWKCGYNPLKQGYTPYGPYLVIIPVTLPNFNWQGGANLWEQRVDCNKVMCSGIPGNKALDYYIVDYVAYPYLLHPKQ